MDVYGCEINSRIDGGAPGYFIIGPFANREDADKVTAAYNKLIDDLKPSDANIVVDYLKTFGYHEDDHGYAHTIAIPVYDNLEPILNGNASVYQAFDAIVKKHVKMMMEIEAERDAAFEHINVKAKTFYDDIVKDGFNNIKATYVRFPDYNSFDIRVAAEYSDGSLFDCIFYGNLGVNNENGQVPPMVTHKVIRKDDNQISETVIKKTIYEIEDRLVCFLRIASGQHKWLISDNRHEDLGQLYYAICRESAKCAYYMYSKMTGIDINKISINIVKCDENVPEKITKKIGTLTKAEDCEEI